MRLHLITAEDPLTLDARARELIRFPQLTMPLLAALTPEPWIVTHTDEIMHRVPWSETFDLVGATAATPGAPHAYELAAHFRGTGATVAMGGPHATLMPYEVAEHADIVVVGEADMNRRIRHYEQASWMPTRGMLIMVRRTAFIAATSFSMADGTSGGRRAGRSSPREDARIGATTARSRCCTRRRPG